VLDLSLQQRLRSLKSDSTSTIADTAYSNGSI